MPGRFEGKVVVVTGASSGMGFHAALAFGRAGARVVLADLESDALHAAADRLMTDGYPVLAVPCDVSDEDAVAAMVARTVDTYGALDVAFNNAGIQPGGQNTADVDGETFDRVIAVNLRGIWACMKHEIRQMQRQGAGVIVNNSSIGGLVGGIGQAAYHASKHGVIGLTKSAALEYAEQNIRVNAIAPGTIDTPLVANIREKEPETYQRILAGQPIKRPGTVDEIASAVLFLAGPESTYVTGTTLAIDGGITAQ